MFTKTLLATAFVSAVSAHQNWHQLWVNDVTPGYQAGIRMPPSNSPVTDVTSNDIVCNVGGSTVPSGVDTIPANEGDTIKVQWDQSGHPGPITHSLFGPVDDASQATGIGAGWFKIDELDYVDGKWANEIMGAANMSREFKLPTGLASGEYLLRSEMLALHGAQTVGGAQFYIGCGQLKITGTGSKGSCTPTIELPGAYNENDANIYIPNVYNGFDATNYTAPGAAIATCGGSGGAVPSTPAVSTVVAPANSTVAAPTSAAATSAAAPITSAVETPVVVETPAAALTSSVLAAETSAVAPVPTLAPFPTSGNSTVPTASPVAPYPTTFATLVRPSADPVASPTGSVGAAKLYYQCGGGVNYTGPTTCEGTAKCVKQNDYYSQCLSA